MSDEIEIEQPSDEAFWLLVDLAQADWEQFQARLRAERLPLVAGFAYMLEGLAGLLWSDRYQAALAGADADCFSEDTIEDLCYWVVSMGRTYFIQVLEDPSRMVASYHKMQEEDASGSAGAPGFGLLDEAHQVYVDATGAEMQPWEECYFDALHTEYGQLLNERRR